jgi:hypothetical protein
MGRSISRKRPWLAAVLAALVTGLGHLYLGRWRRALGWLAVLFGVSALFVEPGALEAFVTEGTVDLDEIAPVLIAGGASVVDAYFVARARNAVARDTAAGGATDRTNQCPNCGKELDADIDFCHWCTTPLDGDGTPGSDDR